MVAYIFREKTDLRPVVAANRYISFPAATPGYLDRHNQHSNSMRMSEVFSPGSSVCSTVEDRLYQ